MVDNQKNPFATWLDNTMQQKGVSNTKLAAAPGINMTAPAVIKWRTGESIPRNRSVIDAIADFFGEDRSKVRMLAGRGGLGVVVEGVDEEVQILARNIQDELDSIENPVVREYRRQELFRLYMQWRDEKEEFYNFLDEFYRNHGGTDGEEASEQAT